MREKLKYSIGLIEKAFKEMNISKDNKGVLAFSGGIDSTCVLNLPPMLKAVKEGVVDLLFNNTLVEFPSTKKFVKKMQDDLGVEIIVAKPNTTFKEIVKRYGFPIHPRGTRDYEKSKATSMCCYYLKKAPTKRMIREHNWPLYVTGLRAEESYTRRTMAKMYGDYFDSKTYGHKKCHPILNWTIKDIWDYQRACGFSYNDLYDRATYIDDAMNKYQVRTGCWCCPQGMKQGKFKWLREHFPKMFKALIINMGLGDAILNLRINKNRNTVSKRALLLRDINYKELFGVEKALELHPCYFDSI